MKVFSRALRRFFTGKPIKKSHARVLTAAHSVFMELAGNTNAQMAEPLKAVVSDITRIKEPGKTARAHAYRFYVSNSFWCISAVANEQGIDFFLLPALYLPLADQAQTAPRRKLRLRANSQGITSDDVVLSDNDLNLLLSSLFNDLIRKSQADYHLIPESVRIKVASGSLTAAVRSLITERQQLLNALAHEQEDLHDRISRDIHDCILTDLAFLRRSIMGGESEVSTEEQLAILDTALEQLRDICTDLSPRFISDWGLDTVVAGTLVRLQKRTGIEFEFIPSETFPQFEPEVLLQIFRIVQECLNNVCKHSRATRVVVAFQSSPEQLWINISDDGIGFDKDTARISGTGFAIMQERVELIKTWYPSSLAITSKHGGGSQVQLRVKTQRSASD